MIAGSGAALLLAIAPSSAFACDVFDAGANSMRPTDSGRTFVKGTTKDTKHANARLWARS